MAWNSKTKHFREDEMRMIRTTKVDDLSKYVILSSPVVSLRILAELLLHKDDNRLYELLKNGEVNSRWMKYGIDYGVDARDRQSAKRLFEIVEQNQKFDNK